MKRKAPAFSRPEMIHAAMKEFERASGVSAQVGNIWYGVIAAIDAAGAYAGRCGALGGKARAAALTAERRSEIARLGGKARWGKAPEGET